MENKDKKRKGYKDIKKQLEADKRWISKNKEHRNYLVKRSTSRNFIKKHAKKEDLEELKELIEENLKKFE